jgi:hypothetical protein
MEIHRQRCQECGSIDLRNIIVRETGQRTLVYARCSKCLELVARYELHAYYHHGKGLQSYLRAQGAKDAGSGREWLSQFKKVQAKALAGYETALAELAKEQKPI